MASHYLPTYTKRPTKADPSRACGWIVGTNGPHAMLIYRSEAICGGIARDAHYLFVALMKEDVGAPAGQRAVYVLGGGGFFRDGDDGACQRFTTLNRVLTDDVCRGLISAIKSLYFGYAVRMKDGAEMPLTSRALVRMYMDACEADIQAFDELCDDMALV